MVKIFWRTLTATLLISTALPFTSFAGNIDNVVIFLRHGENQHTAPWNIAHGSEEYICQNIAGFFDLSVHRYPHLKLGKKQAYYLNPQYEKDLPPGVKSTTNRFIRTADAVKVGYQASSVNGTIDFISYSVPGATSFGKFKKWFCTGEAHTFSGCKKDTEIIMQFTRIEEMKTKIDTSSHPVSIFILARSFSIDLANHLEDDKGSARTKEIKRMFAESLANTSDNDFYHNYWIIQRSGKEWVDYSKVSMGHVNYDQCNNVNFLNACNSLTANSTVDYCSN